MAEQEYGNYDTAERLHFPGARLAKDPEIRDGANGKMVRLQVVGTSRNKGKNGIDDTWYEVNVQDYQAEIASFLKKGDRLDEFYGKQYTRRWGENNERVSICIERAVLNIPPALIKTLKERGFVPGEKKAVGKSKAGKKAPKREVQELPED